MELIERYTISKDWMTLTFLLAFLLIIIAKLVFPERFENFVKLFYTRSYFKTNKKVVAMTDSFTVIFSTIQVLAASLLIYITLTQFYLLVPTTPEILFIQVILGFSLFFMTKYFIAKIMADVFSIENILDPYLFYKITYRNLFGVFLLGADILLIYAYNLSQTFLFITLGLCGLTNLGILVNFYLKKRMFLLSNWFYFILYLCTFEIAPYFILFKLVEIA